jgi:hypothetical protein
MSPGLLEIKELVSRNLTATDISHRLHIPLDVVVLAIQYLEQLK